MIALVAGFYGELFDLIRRFGNDAAALVDDWDGTRDVPVGTELRAMIERTLAYTTSPS